MFYHNHSMKNKLNKNKRRLPFFVVEYEVFIYSYYGVKLKCKLKHLEHSKSFI